MKTIMMQEWQMVNSQEWIAAQVTDKGFQILEQRIAGSSCFLLVKDTPTGRVFGRQQNPVNALVVIVCLGMTKQELESGTVYSYNKAGEGE